ncbi:MAG: DJ-1/PfpI family protein [Spirochaetes bacterium]|nr:DJ-1/PfpI family protein [Spirochaetota bacterium]MBU0955570.1 DJ-1/PfpI family protein [Spirochaetota bacterium]
MKTVLHTAADSQVQTILAGMQAAEIPVYPAGSTEDPYRAIILLDDNWGANLTIEDKAPGIISQLQSFGWELVFASNHPSPNPCHYARNTAGLADLQSVVDIADLESISAYDALIIAPGQGHTKLMADPAILQLIRSADEAGLALAAFCRGVRLLAAAGVLSGRTVSGHADYEAEYRAAGAYFLDYADRSAKSDAPPPVVDGCLVTGLRSNYYRSAMCEAIRIAAANARRARLAAIQPAPPTANYEQKICFGFMLTASIADEGLLLVESLRAMGGRLKDAPVYCLVPAGAEPAALPEAAAQSLAKAGCSLYQFVTDPETATLPFAAKARAAAEAEILAAADGADLLVWLDSDTVFLREPTEFFLPPNALLAARPVHHTLIASAWQDAPNAYWQTVLGLCAVPPSAVFPVQTVMDRNVIRPYFNVGQLVVRPEARILRVWAERLRSIAGAPELAGKTSGLNATFLHQAVFSAVALAVAGSSGIHELSFAYNYPLHLYGQEPDKLRPARLNDLAVVRYDAWGKRPRAQNYSPAADGALAEMLKRFAE